MQGSQADDFESLARRYWAAWGDMLRASTATADMSGAGAQADGGGAAAWRAAMDQWARLAAGATPRAGEAIGQFNRQASRWYAHMQDVAARFADGQGSAADVARAWRETLGSAGMPPFPDMMRMGPGSGLPGAEAWLEAAVPWLQPMREQALGWLRMPAFGAGREHQERMQQLAAHVVDYQGAAADYAALMARAQQEAFPLFEARLAERAESGRPLESGRALFDLWIDAAEEAYAAVALSPEFSEAYGRLVNAQMRVRAGVQRLVEDACAQFGMPTRSELDGAHRKLAGLEREVRRLRDALDGMRRQGGEDASAEPGSSADAPRVGKAAEAAAPDAPPGRSAGQSKRGPRTGPSARKAVKDPAPTEDTPGPGMAPARRAAPRKTAASQAKKGKR